MNIKKILTYMLYLLPWFIGAILFPTDKFHYAWCSSVDRMKESNKFFYTGSRDDMIGMGYEPCKNCDP